MKDSQREAYGRLQDILSELQDLSSEAVTLVAEHFPQEKSWCDAYGVLKFGSSGNPYGRTMEKLLENIEEEAKAEYPDEEDDA